MNVLQFIRHGFGLNAKRNGLARNYDISRLSESRVTVGWPTQSQKVTITARADEGIIGSWANPTGRDIIVWDVVLDVTTKSDGACTANVGVATNATTESDTLIDGVDVGTAAICATVGTSAGTNGRQGRKVTSSQVVTFWGETVTTGLVGKGYVVYSDLPA